MVGGRESSPLESEDIAPGFAKSCLANGKAPGTLSADSMGVTGCDDSGPS